MPHSLAQSYKQIPASAFHPEDEKITESGLGHSQRACTRKATRKTDNEHKQRKTVGGKGTEWKRKWRECFVCGATISLARPDLPGLLGDP